MSQTDPEIVPTDSETESESDSESRLTEMRARMQQRKRAREEETRNTSIDSESPPVPKKPAAEKVNPARNWSFTLNNHTPAEVEMVLKTLKATCSKWAMQEEKGENGTPHLQGCLTFFKKERPMSVFKEFKRIHWEVTRNVAASYNYVQKEETRDGQIWTSWAQLEPPDIYGWQKTVVEMIPEMKSRNVYWFYEGEGGAGKSTLVRYLCMTQGALMVDGNAGDMKSAVNEWNKVKGEGPEYVIVDLPRSKHHVSYAGWEAILNGCFLSTKYEVGMVIVRQPKFIVFSNVYPDNDMRKEMSTDRWQIYWIEKDSQKVIKKFGEGV